MNLLKKFKPGWSEKICLLFIIAVFLILNNLSFITATAIEGADYFTGYNRLAGADKTIYISQIEQARQGHFLFKNLYTSEPQRGLIFSPIWLVLGLLGKITNLSNVLVLEVSRILLSVLFILFVYKFIGNCFSGVKQRLISLLMLCFSSGLGIFTYKATNSEMEIYNRFGADLWLSEGNTFLTLRHSALFILSQIFIILIFWWQIKRLEKAKWPEVLLLGLTVILLGIFHPYDIVIIGAVVAVWFLVETFREKRWRWQVFFKETAIGIMALIPLLYFFWLKAVEPAFAGWAEQNFTPSPGLYNYIVGYGLIFALFLFGIYKCVKSENSFLRFIGIWAIVQWFLLFLPLPVQRRFANSLHIPMVIIATVGLFGIIHYIKSKSAFFYRIGVIRWLVAILLVILLFLTNFFNIIQETRLIYSKRFPVFVPEKIFDALSWLKNHVSAEAVILSEEKMGNIIPSITGGLVYLGHGHQTIDWIDKKVYVNDIFFGTNNFDEQKYQWLKEQNIDYLFFGFYERRTGKFNPFKKDYLQLVWQNNQAAVFKVKK